MAKKIRNKQAELAKKMEMAKQQSAWKEDGSGIDTHNSNPKKETRLSAAEIKAKNDRLRFEELLQKQSSVVLNDYSSDGYLNKEQEEQEILAARKFY